MSLSRVNVCPNTFCLVFQFLSRARWGGSARPPRLRGRNRKLWPGGDSGRRTGPNHDGTFYEPEMETSGYRASPPRCCNQLEAADVKQVYLHVSHISRVALV